ncbi:hypothetical protein [Shewanella sp. UCD-KL21]|uniref:hypothetical protein n=1 Tax=Shewanella sp. UCD-KL21 TaxID=1917164 RepID=UPI0009711AE5|nr:hypothetical protein [Shewanella sp. UCD-KL21]
MNVKVFYIYAPSYDENSGGAIVLHRLCALLNNIDGVNAFLVPRVLEKINVFSLKSFLVSIKYFLVNKLKGFEVNKNWNTPIASFKDVKNNPDAITVYPEVTFGNPLKSPNVVRWFLHQPGHFNKEFCFGVDELYFKFNTAIKDFSYCYSTMSSLELKVIYYPLEYYYENDDVKINTCHAIRKGKHKSACHDSESILIDGKSHQEIGDIFRSSKRFISYDDYTAYSIFATLSGCESIVVPDIHIDKEKWYPNVSDRYGIAYGFEEEELIWAKKTKYKVLEHLENEHRKSQECVVEFVKECTNFFNKK